MEWKRLVRDAREREVAFDYEAFVPSVSVVGAPVRAPSGKVVAVVGALVLESRKLPSLAPHVRRAANMISAHLRRLPSSIA